MQPKSLLYFDLVVPLFNEEKNIEQLVADIQASGLLECGLHEVFLVNNGSIDKTGKIIDLISKQYEWIKVVTLIKNQMYGGGIYEGFISTTADYIGVIPGDNQVTPQDLKKVWLRMCEVASNTNNYQLFAKGRRTVRHDGPMMRIASCVYTLLANIVLGLRVKDVNGQPKIFHRDLLSLLPETRLKTFTFDAQLLDNARRAGWQIIEVPVQFLARRAGVSSWSQKRMHTYKETAVQLYQLRKLRKQSKSPFPIPAASKDLTRIL